jgi:hypothetical protein
VLVIDHAPWHKGALLTTALNAWPHLQWSRWPSERPPLPVIARFWRGWRRRAPHKRLFIAVGALQQARRHRPRDDPTLRHRVLFVRQSPKTRTNLSVA